MTKQQEMEKEQQSNGESEEQGLSGEAVEAELSGVEGGETAPAESENSLMETVAELQQQVDKYKDQALRATAEMENLRRRVGRDVENAHKYALEKFAGELLPVRDSLEMGLNAATNEGIDVNKVTEGVDLTLKMLQGVLEKFGITEVDPLQQRFNPELHQAMSVQESAEVEPNTVLTVYQKGYLLNDRLLRPAMVVVSKAPAADDGGGEAKIDEMA